MRECTATPLLVVSTVLIVIFGEITPQSVCSRHALVVGYYSLPLVFLFVIVCFPVAFPISIVLDKLLGREISGVFSRQMLVSLINLNVNDPEHAKETDLTANDARLLRGALTYKDRNVGDVMTPLANVFSVSEDASLDRAASAPPSRFAASRDRPAQSTSRHAPVSWAPLGTSSSHAALYLPAGGGSGAGGGGGGSGGRLALLAVRLYVDAVTVVLVAEVLLMLEARRRRRERGHRLRGVRPRGAEDLENEPREAREAERRRARLPGLGCPAVSAVLPPRHAWAVDGDDTSISVGL